MSKKSWLKERLDEGLVFLLEEISKKRSVDFQAVHILTRDQAQNTPTPFTTFSLFYNGEFVTHEILSEKKFEKILANKGL